jgi:polyisoprenoid-binding protein YceI
MMAYDIRKKLPYLMSSASQIEGSSIAAEEFSTWDIDPAHSVAEFKVRHLMFSDVKGRFSGLSGVLKLDESDYAHSTVEVSFPAASMTLADDKLDAHLKSENFFNVGKFPTVTFRSTSIRYTGNKDYAVAGELTIRGVTKAVALTVSEVSEPVRDAWANVCIGLSSSAKINRKDFGLVWNERLAFDGLVADEVTITMNVQFIKA